MTDTFENVCCKSQIILNALLHNVYHRLMRYLSYETSIAKEQESPCCYSAYAKARQRHALKNSHYLKLHCCKWF